MTDVRIPLTDQEREDLKSLIELRLEMMGLEAHTAGRDAVPQRDARELLAYLGGEREEVLGHRGTARPRQAPKGRGCVPWPRRAREGVMSMHRRQIVDAQREADVCGVVVAQLEGLATA